MLRIYTAELPTFAHHLGIAGYRTVTNGKWDFVGPDRLHSVAPTTSTRWGLAGYPPPTGTRAIAPSSAVVMPTVTACRTSDRSPGTGFGPTMRKYTPASSNNWAMERGAGDARRPFLQCFSYHHPHEPFRPIQEFWDRDAAADIEIRRMSRDLARHDSAIDRWLHTLYGGVT